MKKAATVLILVAIMAGCKKEEAEPCETCTKYVVHGVFLEKLEVYEPCYYPPNYIRPDTVKSGDTIIMCR